MGLTRAEVFEARGLIDKLDRLEVLMEDAKAGREVIIRNAKGDQTSLFNDHAVNVVSVARAPVKDRLKTLGVLV